MGTKLYREILDPDSGQPTEIKLKAANAAAGYAVKLINGSNGGNGGNGGESEEGKSYEERLREVTFKETIRTVTPSPGKDEPIEAILAENYPQEEEEVIPEEDQLFGKVDEEEVFDPMPQIEEILLKVEQGVSNNDAD